MGHNSNNINFGLVEYICWVQCSGTRKQTDVAVNLWDKNNDVIFQTPFQRLVKRMTRFHTKKTPDKTLYKLKEVLDNLKYNFTVNSPHQVRIQLSCINFFSMQ